MYDFLIYHVVCMKGYLYLMPRLREREWAHSARHRFNTSQHVNTVGGECRVSQLLRLVSV